MPAGERVNGLLSVYYLVFDVIAAQQLDVPSSCAAAVDRRLPVWRRCCCWRIGTGGPHQHTLYGSTGTTYYRPVPPPINRRQREMCVVFDGSATVSQSVCLNLLLLTLHASSKSVTPETKYSDDGNEETVTKPADNLLRASDHE